MEGGTALSVRGWTTRSSVTWIQATGGGEGGSGGDQDWTIRLNVSRSCLATMGTAEVWTGRSVVTSSIAEGATPVLFLWRLLNSAPVFSGVGGGGVCVGRAVNDSTMNKGVGVDLFSRSWGIWTDRKRSGRSGNWEGGRGLRLRKKQSIGVSV